MNAYQIASILQQRVVMFDDPSTFWGRNRYNLVMLAKYMKFPQSAYYPKPNDSDDWPIPIPDAYLNVHWLRGKYLKRLRWKYLKLRRQGKL